MGAAIGVNSDYMGYRGSLDSAHDAPRQRGAFRAEPSTKTNGGDL